MRLHHASLRLAVISSVVLGGLASARAANAAPLRIAVGLERGQELALVEAPSDHTAIRALAQGVREACVDSITRRPRSFTAMCKTLGDVPQSNVCVDETIETALTRQIECSSSDLGAAAVDLSRSGCETAGCYEVEAKKAGATHLFVVAAAWTDSGLTMTGRFIDLADGSAQQVSPSDFAPRYSSVWPRTQPQVLGLLKWLAREQTVLATSRVAQAPSAGGKGELAAPAPTKADLPPASASGDSAGPDRSWLGWTLIGAGVAAGLGSAYVWSKNGDGTNCVGGAPGEPAPCREKLHTVVPALGLGVAAVGALIGGTFILINQRSDRGGLSLFLHSNGAGLGGTF